MISRSPQPVNAQFTTDIFDRIGLDRYIVTLSALGDVCVGWTARGVSAVRLAQSTPDETAFARWYTARTGRPIVRAVELDAIASAATTKLRDQRGNVSLDLAAASPLERDVFTEVAQIQRGYARPFDLVAADVARSTNPSTVAEILARNPVPLIVPCHRVVSTDRYSGTYIFGSDAQRRLLESEGLDLAAIDRVAQRGYRYIGADGWFCLPTCGDIARKIDRPGYVGLHSLSEAHAHGLQACEGCRPVAA